MDRSAVSSSERVMVASGTVNPVADPPTVIVSSPSTTASSVGVTVSVPSADAWPVGIVTLSKVEAP